jgi:hypothetical protein
MAYSEMLSKYTHSSRHQEKENEIIKSTSEVYDSKILMNLIDNNLEITQS